MKQYAILFHKDNADTVAASLSDYSAAELLEEYSWMLETHHTVVLCKDVLDSGFSALSYVVTIGMFYRNAPEPTDLNHKTYAFIRTV